MDIAQLRTLIHVAELGSVTAAADRLGIAQPALSRQLRLLEDDLGGALFTRHGRGMSLTELGKRVVGPSSEILMRLDDIRRCADMRSSFLTGRVRVGVTPTVAEVATLPLVRAIRTAHPDLSLCFTTGFSGHLLEWLKRDELDCCVAYGASGAGLIHTIPILDETLMLIAPPSDEMTASGPIPFASLAAEPLVLPSPAHGLRAILDAAAKQVGITLTPSLEADSLTAMIDLVRTGFGSTILPYAPIHARVMAQELVAVPLIKPVPSRRIVMAYPADRPITPAARFVGETFTNVATELVGSGIWAGSLIAPEDQ